MKRREFLRIGCLTLFAMGGGAPFLASPDPAGGPRFLTGFARAATGSKTLVVLFLRGGLDGLHAVVPHHDPAYYRARPRLAVPPPGRPRGGLKLDERFALHPDLRPLLPLYREGSLAVLHAVGTPVSSRSHFEAQDFLESGGGFTPTRRDGFLNRHVASLRGNGPLRALATTRGVPTTFRGPVAVASVAGIQEAAHLTSPTGGLTLGSLKGASDQGMQRVAGQATRVMETLRRLDPDGYQESVEYPGTDLAEQLRLVAFLLKKGVEVQAVHAELGGFDTHAAQVAPGQRDMDLLFREVAGALAAFWRDLGRLRERVVVVTLSEFGRRFRENASRGTDHGKATCAFVLGAGVRGGRVHGRWPGLAPDRLFEGMDLEVTTDFRDLLIEACGACGCPRPADLFAGYRPAGRPGLLSS